MEKTILTLFQTCSTLRGHVDQYGLHGAPIRVVDEMRVNSLGLQACVDVKVAVPERMANLFQLRLRLRCAQAKRILKRRRSDDRIVSVFSVYYVLFIANNRRTTLLCPRFTRYCVRSARRWGNTSASCLSLDTVRCHWRT